MIIQLSPVPGNIYDSDRFYYDPAGVLTGGPVGAVMAFAAAHGHPIAVHDCPDIQEFQAAHPSAIIRPISEVPPAILARGLFLLASQAQGQVVPAVAVAAPALESAPAPALAPPLLIVPAAPSPSADESLASKLSSPLLSHESSPVEVIPLQLGSYRLLLKAFVLRLVLTSLNRFGFLRLVLLLRFRLSPLLAQIPLVWMDPLVLPEDNVIFLVTSHLPLTTMGGTSLSMGGHLASRLLMRHGADSHSLGGFLRLFLPMFMVLLGLSHFRGGLTPVAASVASTLASAVLSLRPLSQENLSGSSASDLTMSFWVTPPAVPGFAPTGTVPVTSVPGPVAVPLAAPPVAPFAAPAPAPTGVPVTRLLAPAALPIDVVSTGSTAVPPPLAPIPAIRPAKPFKLPAIPDVKSFLNLSSIIQYYLRRPEFSTQRSDDELITDSLKKTPLGKS